MSDEELKEMEAINKQLADEQATNQEAYYWHCLQEFHAILKIFGTTKVMADLKKIKEEVDGIVEKPRIILP